AGKLAGQGFAHALGSRGGGGFGLLSGLSSFGWWGTTAAVRWSVRAFLALLIAKRPGPAEPLVRPAIAFPVSATPRRDYRAVQAAWQTRAPFLGLAL
nr:hypothetical protein [Tanacetum cinerariifolium]